jgi:hypothetical protein
MINFNELTVSKNDKLFKQYNISAVYGIYVNDELVYIGSSIHCMTRFNQHKWQIIKPEEKRCPWKDYRLAYNELRKHYQNGDRISFDIIEREDNVKVLKVLERTYLKTLKPKFNVKDY